MSCLPMNQSSGEFKNILYGDLLSIAVSALQNAGIEEPETDARLLLESVSGLSRTGLLLRSNEIIPSQQVQDFQQFLERRLNREPVAYILEEREFWSLPFFVNSSVLIPRPETEFLVDRVLAMAGDCLQGTGPLLDLCCGSGVIAVVLAREVGRSVIGIDISSEALEVARVNRGRHCAELKLQFVQGDLLDCIHSEDGLSLIVSNPPYVERAALQSELAPEVKAFEPWLALDGGADGMDILRRIRLQAAMKLRKGGQIFMEIGMEQGRALSELFLSAYRGSPGFSRATILQDYAGRDRVLVAMK